MQTALDKCAMMMGNMPQKYLAGAWLLRGLLNEALGNAAEADKDFENAKSYDDNSKRFLEKKESVTLTIFPPMNRLCTHFPFIELSFPKRPKLV